MSLRQVAPGEFLQPGLGGSVAYQLWGSMTQPCSDLLPSQASTPPHPWTPFPYPPILGGTHAWPWRHRGLSSVNPLAVEPCVHSSQ